MAQVEIPWPNTVWVTCLRPSRKRASNCLDLFADLLEHSPQVICPVCALALTRHSGLHGTARTDGRETAVGVVPDGQD